MSLEGLLGKERRLRSLAVLETVVLAVYLSGMCGPLVRAEMLAMIVLAHAAAGSCGQRIVLRCWRDVMQGQPVVDVVRALMTVFGLEIARMTRDLVCHLGARDALDLVTHRGDSE